MGWLPKKKVVVPVDFSELSFQAIDTALELVEKPADLLVLHVLADLSPAETGELWRTIDADMRKQHARQALQERLADHHAQGVSLEVLIGEPGRSIADYAQESHADLIVLPSHGRTGIKRLLIGSIAERVVRHAHCPVLVLRD